MDKLEPPSPFSLMEMFLMDGRNGASTSIFFYQPPNQMESLIKLKLRYFFRALGLKVETFMKHFSLVLKETTSNSNQFSKNSLNTAILVRILLSFVTNSSHIGSKKVSPLMNLLLSLKDVVLNVNLLHFKIH